MTAPDTALTLEQTAGSTFATRLEQANFGSGWRYWVPRLATIGAIVAGGIAAYTRPSVDLTGGVHLSLSEASTRATFSGDGWVLTLSWFGALLAIAATLFIPHSERLAQCLGASFGSILAMAFPFYVSRNLTFINEDATGLGSGLLIAWVLFGLAAVVPWVTVLFINREKSLFGPDWSKWLFVLPAVAWILLLTVFPLTYAFTTSRYQFRNGLISRYVGFDNFRRLFMREFEWSPIFTGLGYAAAAAAAVMVLVLAWRFVDDRTLTRQDLRHALSLVPVVAIPVFIFAGLPGLLRDPVDNAFSITVFFVVVAVSIEMVLGFSIALLLNRELRARSALRAIIILPLFAAPVGIGYLGRTIFFEEGGPVNAALRGLGFSGKPWLSNPFWSRISTIIADVWLWTPFVFVISLAALQALPDDILEASAVDGATAWQAFKSITLPLMSPILWLILFLRVIDAFKVFDIAASMTVGGPGRATEYFSYLTYRTARKNFNYGDAAAQAFLLLIVVSILIIVMWSRIRQVYEEDWK